MKRQSGFLMDEWLLETGYYDQDPVLSDNMLLHVTEVAQEDWTTEMRVSLDGCSLSLQTPYSFVL